MQQDMRYIYTVYQTGSFSKAAKELYITQPALSIAVSRVEKEIGFRLFHRYRYPIEPTEVGMAYIRMVERILQSEREFASHIDDLSEMRTGTLTIGATAYYYTSILGPVLAEFVRRYPGITVRLVESGATRLRQMLLNHEIDLTFRSNRETETEFLKIPAFEDFILLAVPVDFSLNQKLVDYRLSAADISQRKHRSPNCATVPVNLLKDTPLILLPKGFNMRERIDRIFAEEEIEPKILMELEQVNTNFSLAAAGTGVTFIYDLLVRPQDTRLFYYKIASPLAHRHSNIVINSRDYIPQTIKAFIQIFQEYSPI